ncbi:helix-turn-helix domain-containing protein [Chenggangzhangella methanolivorans]|uniref:helix-turn-helix domain-containing protein n=1 Tax=Chenggangzhangella methanolivorans TaxID=1437009 RepID=UPI00361238AE
MKQLPAGALRATFVSNVRRVRTRMGWSQERLALAAGFHRVYVSRLESGKWNVSLDNVERIASALGVDPIELLLHPRSSSPKADDATS